MDKQKLVEFLWMCIEGKEAAITIHFCDPADSRTKALVVSELFHEATGAQIEEVEGKFKGQIDRITFLHNYYGKDGVTIIF